MYKDKDKQKEADRLRQQKRRDRIKAEGVTIQGVTKGVMAKGITLDRVAKVFAIPHYGRPDCECKHCQDNRAKDSRYILNHGPWKPARLLATNELNRVSLPGDADYDGVGLDAKYDSRRIASEATV